MACDERNLTQSVVELIWSLLYCAGYILKHLKIAKHWVYGRDCRPRTQPPDSDLELVVQFHPCWRFLVESNSLHEVVEVVINLVLLMIVFAVSVVSYWVLSAHSAGFCH
jgi:predicted nucleotidyltransferase